jgi:hypothetical protein
LVSGFTASRLRSPVFRGYWEDAAGRLWEDSIVIAFSDTPFEMDTDPALLAAVDDIRGAMFDAYRNFGSPQADVWVTVEAVKTSS